MRILERHFRIAALAVLLASSCTSTERRASEPASAKAAAVESAARSEPAPKSEPPPAPEIDEPIGADMPRQPVPGPDGSMAPHELDFDGRKTPDTSAERDTHANQGFAPIADRMPGERIEVATMREFVAALGSDRTIVMKPGIYVWRDGDVLGYDDQKDVESYAGLSEHYRDGAIRDVQNLSIVGLDGGARILQPDPYDHVLAFHDVRGLTLYNLVLGHHVDTGWCAGGVVRIVGGRDIVLDGLEMFGSGTEGLTLKSVDDLELQRSVVWGCSEQLSTLYDATKIRIRDTVFRDNGPDLLRGFDLARADIELDGVTIRDNRSGGGSADYGSLFTAAPGYGELPGVREDAPPKVVVKGPKKVRVQFRDGEITGNHFARLTDLPKAVVVTGSRVAGNEFAEL